MVHSALEPGLNRGGGVICVFLAKIKIEFRQPPNLILEGCRRLFPKKVVNFEQKKVPPKKNYFFMF